MFAGFFFSLFPPPPPPPPFFVVACLFFLSLECSSSHSFLFFFFSLHFLCAIIDTASTYGGEINTRGNASAGEGTEGQLTSELEDLFVKNKVDVSFYGHIHSYNRMFPVKNNGTYVERTQTNVYRSPDAPVHMMVGMSGAGHLGAKYDTPDWSAHSEISYGWLRATFANATALHLEFVANGDGLGGDFAPAVHDEVWITK